MAIYYARKNGNVNATDVWATTPSGTASDVFSTFTNQDTLIANSFTVTLNVNTTVAEIRNDTTGGATTGGSFSLSNNVILTANIIAGPSICVNLAGTASATVIGTINGGSGSSSYGINNTSTGTLTIVGNVVAGTGGSSIGVHFNGTGTVNISGNCIGGSGSSAIAVWNAMAGSITIAGNVIGGVGTSSTYGAYNFSSGTITITGTVIGGLGSSGAHNNGVGTISIIGIAVGGSNSAGANNNSSGTLNVTRARGNGFGPGSVGVNSVVGVSNSQNGTLRVYEIEYGDLGQSPTSGPIEMITSNSNVAVFAVRLSTPKTLVDLNNATNLVPSSGNVRSGTSYNYGNNVGSCVIPNPNSVVYGVPVDNTVGSGLLSPVAVWNALTSSIATSGSIGERLKNCSTIATVGKQLEGVL